MRRRSSNFASYRSMQRRRFSPLMLIGASIPLVLLLVGATFFLWPKLGSHAATAKATPNGDCTLIVPPNPLTARGLATPYQLVATHPEKGPCNENNAKQAAFVQGAVFDPAKSTISIYDPLVVDSGTAPAVAPVVPKIPSGAVIALWFGSNGNTLTLRGNHGSLADGQCVNGVDGSLFGQFAYCNAPTFFKAANAAISAHKLVPPSLGTASDGQICPTVRDFAVVDQDQSDNVTTTYLMNANGQTAQANTANAKALSGALTQKNGSDNGLLAIILDGTMGCKPWTAPDLADPGHTLTALPLNELQAASYQGTPAALVPGLDPMVVLGNDENLDKINAYRVGVDQPLVQNREQASTLTYCTNLRAISPTRMLLDAPVTIGKPSPDPAVANSLLTFLEQRFVTSYGPNGLNCLKLLRQPAPIKVKFDKNGVAVNGSINGIKNAAMGKK